MKNFQKQCSYPTISWIIKQLLHPILTYFIIIPAYSWQGIGRWILLVLQKLRILDKAVSKQEKKGGQPKYFPNRLPNSLAILGQHQMKKLKQFNNHRHQIAEIYNQEIKDTNQIIKPVLEKGRIYLKYPIIIQEKFADPLLKKLRQKKIFLYDGWQNSPIVPPDTKLQKIGYKLGSCPQSENISRRLINLPTHINISKKQAKHISFWIQKIIAES